ncbi:hypothetical protein ACH5RR_037871 [Cinchona calisaya]|uniref:Uncharacterized protein n=1 Tax=Cinchona calisaya TaxID=153742 RepID=A0ABD2YAG5_9GENT
MLQQKLGRILWLMLNYIANNPEDVAHHQELWQEFERIQRCFFDGMNREEQDERDLAIMVEIEDWYVKNGEKIPPEVKGIWGKNNNNAVGPSNRDDADQD